MEEEAENELRDPPRRIARERVPTTPDFFFFFFFT